MVLICAHVPMSPQARTSVPYLWSGNKVTKKEWIWGNEHADWDHWMASYIVCGSLVVLARHTSL